MPSLEVSRNAIIELNISTKRRV